LLSNSAGSQRVVGCDCTALQFRDLPGLRAAASRDVKPHVAAFPKAAATMTASISAARWSNDSGLVEQQDAGERPELLHEGAEFRYGPI
jgi:hypothetical protein